MTKKNLSYFSISLLVLLTLAGVVSYSPLYNSNYSASEVLPAREGKDDPHMLVFLSDTERKTYKESFWLAPKVSLVSALISARELDDSRRFDEPDEAIRWRMLQLVDENGSIPHNALINAWNQARRMPVDPAVWSLKKGPKDRDISGTENPDSEVAGIQPTGWSWLGPGNIGGRIRSILIHPTNPQIMWAGSVSGGIWKTTNGGATWAALNDFMANLAVSSMAIDPSNPNIIYAGTGEGFSNQDSIRGAGIFKTTDGGTNWTQLSSTTNSDWYFVNRIAINPNNTQILLAATQTGIWRSTDGGGSWSNRNSTFNMMDINFHSTDGTKAIASGTNGAFYSTDGGLNWTQATGLPTNRRIEVAYARSNPTLVYASVDNNNGEVYLSSNGGQTFVLRNTGTGYLGSQGWYDNIIWVDPTNSNIVVVGGIFLWRSTNGGQSFALIGSLHADQHTIVESPQFNGTTNKTVLFGNDGGVYQTNDIYAASVVTTELNNNLGVTQFYGGAGNATSGRIVGGTQDNGTLRYTGGTENWNSPAGGDGGFCASDPTDPNYFFGEYQWLQIHRSADGGQSSFSIYGGLTDATPGVPNFIAPFVLDPNNPNTLLAGGASLWRSTNAKSSSPTWNAIRSSIGVNISAITVAKGNSNIVWVGHNNGDVYFTTNGTAASPSWTRVDTNSPSLPNRYCTRITVDPTNSNRVYVTFGGFSSSNVWRTDNSGTSWSNITANLPSAPIRTLAIWQQNPNYLYVGTEVGIFASADAGQSWSPSNDGPTNCSVDELFWMNNTLVAATHGRGMFSIPITDSGSCTYNVNPTSRNFSASSASSFVDVLTASNCSWTATVNAPSSRKLSSFYEPMDLFSMENYPGTKSELINAAAQIAPETVFFNSTPITINDRTSNANPPATASLYPSNITVSGMTGTITQVDAALNDLSHTFPDDIDVILVGPGGQRAILMSDAGGNADLFGVDLTFSQNAASTLPDATQISSGIYRPTNFASTNTTLEPGGVDNFPSPGPGQTNYTADLSVFNGTAPNGTWKLYVADDEAVDSGDIATGWALGITTSGGGTSWINITSSSSGFGSGTINYNVSANPNTTPRTGTITVNGEVHTVTQSGTTTSACDQSTPISFGQTINGTLTTSDCLVGNSYYTDNYSFSGTSGQQIVISMNSTAVDAYLLLYTSSGQYLTENDNGGGGTNARIPPGSTSYTLPSNGNYRIEASTGPAFQTGAYSINLVDNDTDCTYSIPSENTVSPGNGGGSFGIDTQSGCPWSAASDSPSWLTTSSFGTGDGTVNYNFIANPNTTPRTGRITVGGRVHTVTQLGFGSAGSVRFQASLYEVNESIGTVRINVIRINGTGVGTVQYSTSDGTATGGIDYVPTSGTLQFAEFTTTQFFDVAILEDNVFEGNETINVSLSNPSASLILGNPSSATLTIIDNDSLSNNTRRFDYDGDGKTDISVYRPSNGGWFVQKSTAGYYGVVFGDANDKIAPADYDGDGKTDVAIYRPSEGNWYVLNSSNGIVTAQHFGLVADVPVPGDFDGDGKADINLFRNSNGTWYRLNSSNGAFVANQFGSNGDKPQAGDFDGDGKADIAVFKPSNGAWFIVKSSNGAVVAFNWGLSTDLPVPADYEGDGKTDVAIYRPSQGSWYILKSSDGGFMGQAFGTSTDIPAPGDYDGDGKADVAIFRPSDGNWWINGTTSGILAFAFGTNGDKPTPNAYVY